MKLHTFINEIFDIAKANDKDIGVAVDMFFANIRNAGQEALFYYGGAEKLDFGSLQVHAAALQESRAAYNKAVGACYQQIVELRAQGELDAARELVCAYAE